MNDLIYFTSLLFLSVSCCMLHFLIYSFLTCHANRCYVIWNVKFMSSVIVISYVIVLVISFSMYNMWNCYVIVLVISFSMYDMWNCYVIVLVISFAMYNMWNCYVIVWCIESPVTAKLSWPVRQLTQKFWVETKNE